MTKRIIQSAWLWLLLSATVTAGTARVVEVEAEHVLGTHLQVLVSSPSLSEAGVRASALAEVERLSAIFNTRAPGSEAARVGRVSGPQVVTAELGAVLALARRLDLETDGRFSPGVAPLLVASAAGAGPREIAAALAEVRRLADYTVEQQTDGTWVFHREATGPLALDAVAKGWIVDALADHLAAIRGVEAVLVNIGGEIARRGTLPGVTAGIVNPRAAADNAGPLVTLDCPAALATSGGYERPAHLLDARSGRPADGVLSASVRASTCAEADALATALCLMPPAEGLRLLERHPGSDALIVAADGTVHASAGWPGIVPLAAPAAKDGEIVIEYEIINSTPDLRYHKPYASVWIEDAAGKHLRELGIYGKKAKHWSSLKTWWATGGRESAKDRELISTISGASRPAGKHRLVWDGKDNAGQPVPPGKVFVCVEINREKGPNRSSPTLDRIAIDLAQPSFSVKGKAQAELGPTTVIRK